MNEGVVVICHENVGATDHELRRDKFNLIGVLGNLRTVVRIMLVEAIFAAYFFQWFSFVFLEII